MPEDSRWILELFIMGQSPKLIILHNPRIASGGDYARIVDYRWILDYDGAKPASTGFP